MSFRKQQKPGRILAGGAFLFVFLVVDTVRGQTVRIPEEVEAVGSRLILGDIAAIEPHNQSLAELSLGHSPYAGHYRWLSRSEVKGFLRRWSFAPDSIALEMPDRVLVTRRSQIVDQNQVRDAILDYFHNRGEASVYQVERVEFSRQVAVPEGELLIEVEAAQTLSTLRSLPVKVMISVDGQLQKSQWARVHVKVTGPVAVAVRDLAKGHRIQMTDLALEMRELVRPGAYVGTLEELVGQVTIRPIRASALFKRAQVRRSNIIRRGDMVSLIAGGRHFTVRATGRARGAGSIGDVIEVENLQSRKTVRATITGEGEVRALLIGANR